MHFSWYFWGFQYVIITVVSDNRELRANEYSIVQYNIPVYRVQIQLAALASSESSPIALRAFSSWHLRKQVTFITIILALNGTTGPKSKLLEPTLSCRLMAWTKCWS
jgi:hypothetical protein